MDDEPELVRLETQEERERIFGALRHLPVHVIEAEGVPAGAMDIRVIIMTGPGGADRIRDTIAVIKEHNADGQTTHGGTDAH